MMPATTVGAVDDYFDLQFMRFAPRKQTISSREQKVERTVVEPRHLSAKAQRTFHESRDVMLPGAPTAAQTEIEAAYLDTASGPSELDEIRGAVRSFAEIEAGWDGPDSSPPLPGAIDDALEVLQNWSSDLIIPEPALVFDGSIALELYDECGFSRGGMEFKGNRRAIYTVIFESEVLSSGTFNAGLLSEIIKSIDSIRRALSAEPQ